VTNAASAAPPVVLGHLKTSSEFGSLDVWCPAIGGFKCRKRSSELLLITMFSSNQSK